ncbi:MAG: GNAT family N-acetyltransferase [Planctomycetes bacterium]|jgi:ribosomal protein S18 acetylase RimI-like enzyme|nr:GNAT family N-acetyltransferase [Planctomycetota bacterium]
MSSKDAPKIRILRQQDVDAIVEIDRLTLGKQRWEYWEEKVRWHLEHARVPSLVAELGTKVVGFVFGDASGQEYGIPASTAVLDVIGVHPKARRKGIARLLIEEMIVSFKKKGMTRVATFVSWRSVDLLRFSDAMGFERGDMINLEKKI